MTPRVLRGWTRTEEIMIGDRIPVWCAGTDDGLATVVGIVPYAGRERFTRTLTVTAKRTASGVVHIAVADVEHFP